MEIPKKDNSGNVSVIIPARNEEKNIKKCIDKVLKQKTGKKIEVTVIDSGSSDNTINIIRGYKNVNLREIKAEEFRHGRTRNLALEMGDSEYIVFLNADAQPADEFWLEKMLAALDSDPKVAGVYSRHLPQKNCHLYTVKDLSVSMPDKKLIKTKKTRFDSLLFSTVSAAVRRSVLSRIPFDNSIDIAEDQNWGGKILNSGYTIVYEPESKVIHSHNYSLKRLFFNKIRNGKSSRFFKLRITALFLGPFVSLAGIFIKIWKDFKFIITSKNISAGVKIREIFRSIMARTVSFTGKYIGWLKK